ncbi:tetratricopeptide repeat protein [Nonomuraea sp. NPDC049625]|uniref:tetratricopeptide repeat protein n=1 Tax=Nonomuraea sp. NPDC049625 TaxID=3155775 RepID=UPI003424487A
MADDGKWDRHSVFRGAAVLAGAAATAPLLGAAATASAGSGDADALFKAGEFEQAGRAYEEILKTDPTNVHAARQRGYVGLLSNRFPDAEKYLKMAIDLAPDDSPRLLSYLRCKVYGLKLGDTELDQLASLVAGNRYGDMSFSSAGRE